MPNFKQMEEPTLQDGYTRTREEVNRTNPVDGNVPEHPIAKRSETQQCMGCAKDTTLISMALGPLKRSIYTIPLKTIQIQVMRKTNTKKKPRCYKDQSDGCTDTWIEAVKLHFSVEDLTDRQECSALTSN